MVLSGLQGRVARVLAGCTLIANIAGCTLSDGQHEQRQEYLHYERLATALTSEKGDTLFTAGAAQMFHKEGVSIDDLRAVARGASNEFTAQKLLGIANEAGSPPSDITKKYVEFRKHLPQVSDPFLNGFKEFVEKGYCIEDLETLVSLRTASDESIEWGHSIEDPLSILETKPSKERLLALNSIRDRFGHRIFGDPYSILKGCETHTAIDNLTKIGQMAEWSAYSLTAFLEQGGNESVLNDLKRVSTDGFRILRMYQLEFTANQILDPIDTVKPNALVTLPEWDSNGIFQQSSYNDFIKSLKDFYDVSPYIVSGDTTLYAALDQTPDIALWVAAGHGSGKSTTLGAKAGKGDPEYFTLDTSDIELAQHLKNLRPDAVIFFDNCFNGIGKEAGDNLANMVAGMVPRTITLISATVRYEDITVTSMYPFACTILLSDTSDTLNLGKDVTYVTNGKLTPSSAQSSIKQ